MQRPKWKSVRAGFGPLFAANAAAAVVRRVGTNGLLDLHVSPGLAITQLIGSVAALDRGPQGLLARVGSGLLHSNNAVELNIVERGQAVGVCLDVAAPLAQPHAHVQVLPPFRAGPRDWPQACVAWAAL